MNNPEINELVSEILHKCECERYAKYFQELNKHEFGGLTLFDLKERLSKIEDVDQVAGKIHQEIIRFSSLRSSGINGQDSTSNCASNNVTPLIKGSAQKTNAHPCNGTVKPELSFVSGDVSAGVPVVEKSAEKTNEEPYNGTIKPELTSDAGDVSECAPVVERSAQKRKAYSCTGAVKPPMTSDSEDGSEDAPVVERSAQKRKAKPCYGGVKPPLTSDSGDGSGSEGAPEVVRSVEKTNERPPNRAIKSELTSDSEDDRNEDEDYEPLLPPRRTASQPVVEVSLDSSSDSEVDEDSANGAGNNLNCTSTFSNGISSSNNDYRRHSFRKIGNNASINYYESNSSDSDDEPGEKRLKLNLTNDITTREFFSLVTPLPLLKKLGRNPDSMFDQCCNLKLLPDRSNDLHQCDLDDPPLPELKHWEDFYKKVGSHIYSLNLHIWTWKAPRSNCPYNLLTILKRCKNLEELRFSSEILPQVLEKLRIPSGMTLLCLRKIAILHSGEIIYLRQLKSILKATVNLSSFQYSFHSLEEANSVLDILQPLDENLERFRCLTIRPYTKDGYLTREQMLKLAEIPAPNLEELEIGNGLWEDVDGSCFGAVLKNFSKLKKLKVVGNYQGDTLRKPEILLSIPPLPSLQFLDIGGNYEFASMDQSRESSNNSSRVITVEDDLKTELFAVSIEFPLLPNLKTLILGNLFKIDDLHFSSFPSLEAFRVGSPWHLAVKFSSNEASRKYSYPLITELQIPDCLKDPSFVQSIPSRFPNLKRCWIFLPSVRVLRTFFKGMEESGLEELYLRTQYDFEATIELCLLGNPTRAPLHYYDHKRHEELEAYGKFSEFVSFYNIELPPKEREELKELEDPTCAGLKVLRSLKVLNLKHIPRILRIPKGDLHWTHSNAEFTDSYIGFQEYPLSPECVSQLSFLKNLKTCVWPNFKAQDRGLLRGTRTTVIASDGLHFDQVSCSRGYGPCSSKSSAAPSKPKPSRTITPRGEKLKVQIQPAMLQAKFYQKDEKA